MRRLVDDVECSSTWAALDTDIAAALSAFEDALEGVLAGEMHEYAIGFAQKGMIPRPTYSCSHSQTDFDGSRCRHTFLF
jgi:hypothetical protein